MRLLWIEGSYEAGDLFDLRQFKFGIERQGKDFGAGGFGVGEITGVVAEIAPGLLVGESGWDNESRRQRRGASSQAHRASLCELRITKR